MTIYRIYKSSTKPLVHINWIENEIMRVERQWRGFLQRATGRRKVLLPWGKGRDTPKDKKSLQLGRELWAVSSAISEYIGLLVSDPCLEIYKVKTSLVSAEQRVRRVAITWDQSVPSICWGKRTHLFSRKEMQVTPKKESQQIRFYQRPSRG